MIFLASKPEKTCSLLSMCKVYHNMYANKHVFIQIKFQDFISGRHIVEPRYDISNNVVCTTSKASDQPAHLRSLIRVFASRLNIV